ncbi:hypothetical protein [Qipengyuania aquimaris]|uniref:hypothetical protein n=1 Tax=Qipengyuania aquimaris TaxID=255984 RepID=UPI001CD66E39|nr:hypothetical protein [Qipengyuania aquimaris]MCA0903607.1 hypothetical protein [Qipengyuania aquimaris]
MGVHDVSSRTYRQDMKLGRADLGEINIAGHRPVIDAVESEPVHEGHDPGEIFVAQSVSRDFQA